uniref:NADH-ubiquinone oxidoreductase chain 2 n=1 Tax=Onychodactylus zhangyapingi TaxID=1248183 RepID=A0A0E3DEN4_9AMPH|nr:NADH dehydrogenase subunit 2 [Onychodactylus zhangyapingi]AIC83059.1 NADH dehydrogenase subunit 2 [Onychodactylus zhangyapingi]WPT27236.1 NADH dehydrogenase subunit 2 [Onychodactylus zhangyapingi]WPT27249.1 NADH dehydrogenase subunit 2 [Onychodactylus zhangyapingi]WPT27262.1 NADH dehydrogenase subunit 2 [Onychodactylus zhangyapingi]WPT27275.1 NADH dehydrogenase subunit 2 [Onychodactylus zhangyapingi]
MSPYALSIMLSSLSIGTLMTFISYHWFLAWMGLEINTLAIIPLMTKLHHPRATESATKYFLIQASASALILFSSTINAWLTGEWTILNMENPLSLTIITIALAMKLGIAPFHLWMPDVLQGLNLMTGLIMSTWQKMAPMALLILLHQQLNSSLLMIMALLSTIVGGWGGLNQTQLRKIMAYSSIAHIGWMLLVLTFLSHLTAMNFMMYLLMTTSMFIMLINFSALNINKLSTSWIKSPILTSMMMILLMSLGGLPPTSGFIPKWLILQEITKQNYMLMATMMAFTALMSLFFYLRLSYTISLTTSPNMSNSKIIWRLKNKPTYLLSMLTVLSIMLLPITPLMTNIY